MKLLIMLETVDRSNIADKVTGNSNTFGLPRNGMRGTVALLIFTDFLQDKRSKISMRTLILI